MNTFEPQGSTAVAIAASIERLIRHAHWPPGFRLPTVRALSEDLGVNPGTVSTAYKLLRDAGAIVTDGRRGTFVQQEIDIRHTEMAVPAGLIDLASGNVDPQLLPQPQAGWLADYHQYTGNLYTGRDDVGDHPPLQALFREHIFQPCGIEAEPVLFAGSLDVFERALMQRCIPGAKVLVEDPCWAPLLPLLASLRLEAVPMSMDAEGAILPGHDVLHSAAAMIITVRAHNPTGTGYSAARWQQLATAMADKNLLLIVDDYWQALSTQPPPDFRLLYNEWLYCTATSKFLGSDLRLAAAAGNGSTIRAMKHRFSLGPRWISGLLQYLVSQAWQDMLRHQSLPAVAAEYAARRHALISALQQREVAVNPHGEGLHVWIPVQDETFAMQILAANGWAVQAGKAFSPGKQSAIRVSLSNLPLTDTERLANDIAAIWAGSTRAWY